VRRSYVVSKGAAADFREITQYTLKTWGEVQRRAYIAETALFCNSLPGLHSSCDQQRAVCADVNLSHFEMVCQN
jgi:plasmid stabilization system protein ParE